MRTSIFTRNNAPSSAIESKPIVLSWQEVITFIDTDKFIALHNGIISFEEFYERISATRKYILEDCTDIRSHDFIAQMAKFIARYHDSDLEEINDIAKEIRRQEWQLTDKDSEMRDCFIRLCRAMCRLDNYLLLIHSEVLDYLSKEDLLILEELKKHSDCKIIVYISDIEDFNKYSNKFSVFKFINMDRKEFPLVYISHHWDGDSDIYVNGLRSALKAEGIQYGIDTEDAEYRTKIKDFEEKLGDAFIVVPVVNSEYLQSIDCMYELAVTSKNGHIEDRLFPLIIFDIKRNGEGLKEQLNFWKAKNQKYREGAKQLGVGSANIDNDEIVRVDIIYRQLPTIWEYFKKYLTSTKEQLSANNYALMIKGIKKRLALLGNNSNSPTPCSEQLASNLNTTIRQTGEHAVNINNIGGNITINQ